MQLAVDAATAEARADGLDARAAREALPVDGPARAAASEYRAALAAFPGYVYALDALAQVEAARGRDASRDRPRAARRRRDPAAAVRRRPRRPLPRRGTTRGRTAPVRADRRDRAACSSRTASRPTSRPRSSTSTTASACASRSRSRGGAGRAALDRRRRRARLGARAQRPLRRGAALLEARAPPRHAGRAQVLPPRDDRALPRPRAAAARVTCAARWRSTRTSRSSGRRSRGGRCVKRLVVFVVVARRARRSGGRARASARQLHGQPLQPRRGLRATALYVRYVLDLAEIPTFQAGQHRRARVRTPDRAERAPRPSTAPRASSRAHRARASERRRRPGHDAARGRARGAAARRHEPRSPTATRTTRPHRLEGDRRRRGHAQPQPRAARVPEGPAAEPARRHVASPPLAPGTGPTSARALDGTRLQAPDRVADSGFAALVGRSHLSALVILASLAAALFWGAAHALSPGHGKTIVTAYLVGQRGTPRHAALLGLIVTVTHTIGVFALGLVTLALSQFIVPDRLYPWLNLASGLLVVGIGASVFWHALAAPPRACPRPPPPSPRHARGLTRDRAELPLAARRRRLRRPPALPLGARRPAGGDLAAPRRLRARS